MIFRLLALGSAAGVALATLGADRADALPTVPRGFSIERIASVPRARELAIAPNGDLFVGTSGTAVYVVPNAEKTPGEPRAFVAIDDRPVAGVFLARDTLYVGTNGGVYRLPYRTGDREARAAPQKIASVRPGGRSGHSTTTVAFTKGVLYASVGSSCNACKETDPTRATVQAMNPDGTNMHARAVGIRNAIALAVQPQSDEVWLGDAGRDDLQHGHPYEIIDALTPHPGTADYGWPRCYENRKPVEGTTCGNVVVPRAVMPAYDTPIGAAFYPLDPKSAYAFPASYHGGLFVALHGSWHQPLVPPRVAFIPFKNGEPAKPVDWSNPDTQWTEFLRGCQSADGSRTCRPTGLAVGTDGSLFIADDYAGAVYRVRPVKV